MLQILLQAAPAAQPAAQQGGLGSNLGWIYMIVLFAIIYFLMIRPQQKRQKEIQKMLDSVQVNDKVIMTSGIYGRIVTIKPDKHTVVVEIDDTNKIRVEFQRSAIATIVKSEENAVTA